MMMCSLACTVGCTRVDCVHRTPWKCAHELWEQTRQAAPGSATPLACDQGFDRQQSWVVVAAPSSRVRIATRERQTPLKTISRLIVVQDRTDAAVLGELRITAEPEQVEVEGLVA